MKKISMIVISIAMALCIYGIIIIVVDFNDAIRNTIRNFHYPPDPNAVLMMDPNIVEPVIYDVVYDGVITRNG